MTHRGRCAGGDTVADPLGGRRHRADLPGAGRVPAQRDLNSERGLLGVDERARHLLPFPAAAARPVHDATPGSDRKRATHAVRSASPRAHRTPTPAPVQRMDRAEAGEPRRARLPSEEKLHLLASWSATVDWHDAAPPQPRPQCTRLTAGRSLTRRSIAERCTDPWAVRPRPPRAGSAGDLVGALLRATARRSLTGRGHHAPARPSARPGPSR